MNGNGKWLAIVVAALLGLLQGLGFWIINSIANDIGQHAQAYGHEQAVRQVIETKTKLEAVEKKVDQNAQKIDDLSKQQREDTTRILDAIKRGG